MPRCVMRMLNADSSWFRAFFCIAWSCLFYNENQMRTMITSIQATITRGGGKNIFEMDLKKNKKAKWSKGLKLMIFTSLFCGKALISNWLFYRCDFIVQSSSYYTFTFICVYSNLSSGCVSYRLSLFAWKSNVKLLWFIGLFCWAKIFNCIFRIESNFSCFQLNENNVLHRSRSEKEE